MLVQEYLGMVADFRGLAPERRQLLLAEAIWDTELEQHLTRRANQGGEGGRGRGGYGHGIGHGGLGRGGSGRRDELGVDAGRSKIADLLRLR